MSRQVVLRSESAAESQYRKLAREISGWCGAEWRKRFGDGERFDLQRFHLRREGRRIELEIDVSTETWKEFSG